MPPMNHDERLARIEVRQENFEDWMRAHEIRCEREHEDTSRRLTRIERTLWLATGAVLSAQALFTMFFLSSLKQLLGLH